MKNWEEVTGSLELRIGYVFKDKLLLRQALSHSSYINEQMANRLPSYERLEFLGDAVLDLVASEFLMGEYPEMPEGELTKTRSRLVCEATLEHQARELKLGQYLLLGKGEEASGGRERASLLSDVIEALIGAIYLDSGFEDAKSFIHNFILTNEMPKQLYHDSKSDLQEYVIKKGLGKLRYELTGVSGPEHDKDFHVDLYLDDEKIGSATGKSKKSAEQRAAFNAIEEIKPLCT
jgi:ribonuclease-3